MDTTIAIRTRNHNDSLLITRLLGRFKTLLEGIAADPTQRLSELPLLTADELRQLLVEWNETATDYPKQQCVHQLFEAQVKQTPDAVAVVYEDEQVTYGELNRRANQVAHYLRKRGVKTEVLVAICMERSIEMVVGLLGILKAGAAYLPLDAAYPQERLRFMLEDAEVPVLLAHERLVESLPQHRAEVVRLDADWKAIAEESTENPESGVSPENLAYVIYTSGSTGKPKGVQIPHRAVVNFLTSMRQQPGLTREDVLLAITTLSFDIAGLELYLPLSVGARLIIVSRDVAADGTRLQERLADVTAMQATPATWRLLLEARWTGNRQLKILCGGEALSRKLANQLLDRSASVWNMYGPTETTIWSATYKVEREQEGSVPIGRPIANTQLYVLDLHLQPVPVGVAGELYIGGDGLARGYLNRPALTTERFIPHPFSGDRKARLYKTGDLARYLPDGNIEYLGRMDHQVKVRGYRIELGEVEAVLSEHPGVRESVVIVREDAPGDNHLVAYIVPNGGEPTPSVSELRSFLGEKLPTYMVPQDFVPLNELPLTPNGKVDRRALPAPDLARPKLEVHFVAARDELELQLIKLWEEVLSIQPIGVYDNFFELGGDSLLAVRLFAQISDVFGQDLPLATLFQTLTVEQLADMLRQKGWRAPWSSLVAIQPSGSKPPFFGIHGAGANILMYRALAQHLGTDQPVYGLHSQGLDGKAEPYTRADEMAAHYINEIRTVQPRGPYYLGGVSFGGVVAFEMAQQLHAQGERVALLAMFNSDCPGPNSLKYLPDRKPFHSIIYPFIERVDIHLEDFRRLGSKRYLIARARATGRRIKRKFWKLTGKTNLIVPGPMDHLPPVLRRVWETNLRAEKEYLPQHYPDRITFFWASEGASRPDRDTRSGWIELAAGGVEFHAVPGDHATMREAPHVRVLAEKLSACLHRAQKIESVCSNVADEARATIKPL